MNLRDIRYLVAVADLASFSKAADLCCVSQPTLSNQIRKAEEELGLKVFERTNKQVLLTDAGREIITSARRALREVDTMLEYAEQARDPLAGRFRLGAIPTLASYVFPALVPRVSEALPKLHLILVEEKTDVLVQRLNEGRIDAAIMALPLPDDRLETVTLYDDRFRLAVPKGHPLATRKMVTGDMLAAHRLLLLDEGHCLRDQALDVCRLYDTTEDGDVRATSLETLRMMVKAGSGITLMPEIAIGTTDDGIVYIPFTPPEPRRTIGLVWRRTTARRPVIEKLRTLLAD